MARRNTSTKNINKGKAYKNVSLRVESQGNVTQTEQEILELLTKEFLTPKQVSIRRGTSVQAVYIIRNRLKRKGLLNKAYKELTKNQPTMKGQRLHGQEFNIKVVYKGVKFKGKVGKTIRVDGNTVRVYRNSVEVYSGHSFYADDEWKAFSDSLKYWWRFFVRLENDLDCILVKERVQNITGVCQHFGELGNELAEDSNRKDRKVRIYSSRGCLWALADRSWNVDEFETVHPETSKEDMGDVIRPFFNDLRENRPGTISDLKRLFVDLTSVVLESAKINKDTAAGLNAVVNVLRSQMPKREEGVDDRKDKPRYFG